MKYYYQSCPTPVAHKSLVEGDVFYFTHDAERIPYLFSRVNFDGKCMYVCLKTGSICYEHEMKQVVVCSATLCLSMEGPCASS